MENKMKISSEELAEVLKKTGSVNVAEVDWNGYTLSVKHFLELTEMIDFVNSVVAGCFAKSDNSYIPEARDFFFRCFIVDSYTNIELPESVEEKNTLVYGTNIIETILRYIDMGQFQAIIEAIEKKLNYLVDVNVKQVIDEAELVYQQITELYAKLEDVFSGVSKDDIAAISHAIAGTSIDEKKIVDAVIEARNAEPNLKVVE